MLGKVFELFGCVFLVIAIPIWLMAMACWIQDCVYLDDVINPLRCLKNIIQPGDVWHPTRY